MSPSNTPDITGFASLGADINKRSGDLSDETKEGVVSEKLPELTLDMKDEDIINLTKKWEKEWDESAVKQEWVKKGEENEKYWLGNHFNAPRNILDDKERAMVDNLIFESLETFLPQATRRNPEPTVTLHSTENRSDGEVDPAHTAYLEKVTNRLVDLADENVIRLKLKKTARHWAIFLLGVAKFGWDLDKDIPIVRIIRPKKIILDPTATIDEDGYTGERIGEFRKMPASKILAVVGEGDGTKDAREAITKLVKGDDDQKDLGTDINFIEWWTKEFMVWKLGPTVLLKKKNPHWNYDETVTKINTDEFGNETESEVETLGINHFPVPDMPYRFLTVFNLGDRPMDVTSLMGQNLSNQDVINKRNRQIDKNADNMNGGMVISLERSGLSKHQAAGVSQALRKGGVVMIPSGAPKDAIDRHIGSGLPTDVFNNLLDTRNRLRDIFGTKGSAPAGLEKEPTVRGKIINRTLDTDRIGGGVSEYLEQLADGMYNWFVQLLYVYDSGFQFVEDARPPKINVSVIEGSLLPKDSITIANQAFELAGLNRISNIDLYKRLEYPNPEQMAANVWLEANAPHLLYKDNQMVQQAIAEISKSQQDAEDKEVKDKDDDAQRDIDKEKAKSESKPPTKPNLKQAKE